MLFYATVKIVNQNRMEKSANKKCVKRLVNVVIILALPSRPNGCRLQVLKGMGSMQWFTLYISK